MRSQSSIKYITFTLICCFQKRTIINQFGVSGKILTCNYVLHFYSRPNTKNFRLELTFQSLPLIKKGTKTFAGIQRAKNVERFHQIEANNILHKKITTITSQNFVQDDLKNTTIHLSVLKSKHIRLHLFTCTKSNKVTYFGLSFLTWMICFLVSLYRLPSLGIKPLG